MDTRSGQIIEKEILVLSLDFIFGPISKDYQDDICNKLDKKINELYSSLWIPNDNDASGYSFDEEKEKELAPKILELLKRLIARLNDINDGSFEIDDMVTGHYVDLLKK